MSATYAECALRLDWSVCAGSAATRSLLLSVLLACSAWSASLACLRLRDAFRCSESTRRVTVSSIIAHQIGSTLCVELAQ